MNLKFSAIASVIALGMVAALSGQAHAQSTSTSLSGSIGADENPAIMPTTLDSNSGAGTSTTRLDDVMSKFKKLPLSFIFYTRTDVKKPIVANSTGAPTSFNFVGTGYNLSDTKSVIVRQEFNYDYPHLGVAGKAKLKDVFVGFNNTALATFMGDGALSSSSRLYLPTGEDSRFLTHQNGELIEWLTASKPLGRFNLDVHLIGYYDNQTQDSYQQQDPVTGEFKTVANIDYEVEQFTILTYNFSDRFAVYQLAGVDSLFMKPLPGDRPLRSHFTELETGITFKPTKVWSTTLSFFNYAAMNNSDAGYYGAYRDADSVYRFTVIGAI